MKLRINPLAVNDWKDIRDFIAEDNRDKATEVINKIFEFMERLQSFPNIGTDLSKRVSFKTDYKFFVWNDYVIIYKNTKEYIEIYRVINRYRDITKIFE